MKALLLTILLCSPAMADVAMRPGAPYTRTVDMSWLKIPYPNSEFDLPNGYVLKNPAGFACAPCFGADDWFQTRLLIDPMTKTVTILSAYQTMPVW